MALSRTNLLGQISPTPTGSFGTGNFTTNSFTPPSNSLLVVGISIIENSGTTTDPLSSITVSGGGWTYTGGPGVSVSPTSFPTATKVFTAPVGTGASMTLTIGTGGRSIGEYSVTVVAYTGHNTGAPTGATATGTQGSGFTGPPTPFSITLSAAPASTSEVFAVAGMDKTVAGASPGTTGTWTEVDDVENTDWGGLESQARTGSTSTTVDWADLRSGGGALFNVAAVAIEIVAASASASATPVPIVITQLARPPQTPQPLILRSTLADPPVLTAQPPIVTTRPAQLSAPTTTLAIRSTLSDPPVLTTQSPQVVTRPSPVVTPPPTLLSRSSLQDYSAAAPLVVSRPPPAPPATTTLLSRASLADVAAATASTPPPIVVSGTTVRPPSGSATVLRSTLADPPVLTTPAPLVVSAPTKAALPGPVISLRGSLVDLATAAPIVVTAPSSVARTGPAFLSRSSPADAVVPVGVATPQPIVVTNAIRPPWAYRPIVLTGSSSQICDCTTHRPNGGITTRPGSGVTTRPNIGVTARPCTC